MSSSSSPSSSSSSSTVTMASTATSSKPVVFGLAQGAAAAIKSRPHAPLKPHRYRPHKLLEHRPLKRQRAERALDVEAETERFVKEAIESEDDDDDDSLEKETDKFVEADSSEDDDDAPQDEKVNAKTKSKLPLSSEDCDDDIFSSSSSSSSPSSSSTSSSASSSCSFSSSSSSSSSSLSSSSSSSETQSSGRDPYAGMLETTQPSIPIEFEAGYGPSIFQNGNTMLSFGEFKKKACVVGIDLIRGCVAASAPMTELSLGQEKLWGDNKGARIGVAGMYNVGMDRVVTVHRFEHVTILDTWCMDDRCSRFSLDCTTFFESSVDVASVAFVYSVERGRHLYVCTMDGFLAVSPLKMSARPGMVAMKYLDPQSYSRQAGRVVSVVGTSALDGVYVLVRNFRLSNEEPLSPRMDETNKERDERERDHCTLYACRVVDGRVIWNPVLHDVPAPLAPPRYDARTGWLSLIGLDGFPYAANVNTKVVAPGVSSMMSKIGPTLKKPIGTSLAAPLQRHSDRTDAWRNAGMQPVSFVVRHVASSTPRLRGVVFSDVGFNLLHEKAFENDPDRGYHILPLGYSYAIDLAQRQFRTGTITTSGSIKIFYRTTRDDDPEMVMYSIPIRGNDVGLPQAIVIPSLTDMSGFSSWFKNE
jgi:hypothetical protein